MSDLYNSNTPAYNLFLFIDKCISVKHVFLVGVIQFQLITLNNLKPQV